MALHIAGSTARQIRSRQPANVLQAREFTGTAMPILALVGAILYFGCILHAIASGRINRWLVLLVFLPVIGSVIYLLFEVFPAAQTGGAAQEAMAKVADRLDPERSADNRRRLAEEFIAQGQWDEALGLYRGLLVGPLVGNPILLIGVARACFGKGDFQGALDALDALQRHNPGYRSREGHMIYARSLERVGRTREAAEEYRAVIDTALGPEARVRYGLLMKAEGESALAERAFREVVNMYGLRRDRLDPEDQEWLKQAERNLA